MLKSQKKKKKKEKKRGGGGEEKQKKKKKAPLKKTQSRVGQSQVISSGITVDQIDFDSF